VGQQERKGCAGGNHRATTHFGQHLQDGASRGAKARAARDRRGATQNKAATPAATPRREPGRHARQNAPRATAAPPKATQPRQRIRGRGGKPGAGNETERHAERRTKPRKRAVQAECAAHPRSSTAFARRSRGETHERGAESARRASNRGNGSGRTRAGRDPRRRTPGRARQATRDGGPGRRGGSQSGKNSDSQCPATSAKRVEMCPGVAQARRAAESRERGIAPVPEGRCQKRTGPGAAVTQSVLAQRTRAPRASEGVEVGPAREPRRARARGNRAQHVGGEGAEYTN